MVQSLIPRVFVSAVSSDLQSARKVVNEALTRIECLAVEESVFGTEYGPIREMIARKIDSCQAVIHLVGRDYGGEPDPQKLPAGERRRSWTQLEYDLAKGLEPKQKLYLLVCDDVFPFDALTVPEPADKSSLQLAHHQTVLIDKNLWHTVRTVAELAQAVERMKIHRDLWVEQLKAIDEKVAEVGEQLATQVSTVDQHVKHTGRRLGTGIGIVVAVSLLILGVTLFVQHQQRKEAPRREQDRIALQQEHEKQDREREQQGAERRKQDEERLAAEASRQQTRKIEQLEQEFADRFLHQLLANKDISAEDARQQALKELPALVKLPLEEVVAIIDGKIPLSAPAGPVSPLKRALTALAQGTYDEVFRVADEERQEGRLLAMLEGTAALAKFRESPNPEWNNKAIAAFRRALALSDKGSKDWAVAAISSASMLSNLARYADAEPLLIEAQQILEDRHGRESSEVAVVLNNLSLLLQATNRLAEAEPLIRRALAIDEQSFGAEPPNVAVKLNNLAQLLQTTDRLAEAEPLMRRALAIDEQSYGAEAPNVGRDLNNLAQLLKATNRLAESEPLMRRALAIDEQSYGAEHPDVAIDLNNLAGLLKDTNRMAEAETLMRRALSIDEQSYGAEHPDVAINLNNFAQLLKPTNRLAEAEPLIRRALAIDEQSFGAEHPNVANCLNNLAWLLTLTNRLVEAEPLMRRALAIDEQSYGAEHPNVANRLNNLAQLLKATNRLAEAEPLMRRALAIYVDFKRRTGHEHPSYQGYMERYSDLLQDMKLSDVEIAQKFKDATLNVEPLKPIRPEVERLLGPAKPVADVLAALDQQYKADAKPDIYFLKPDQPIAPHLEELLRANPDSLNAAGLTAFRRQDHANAVVHYEESLKLLADKPEQVATTFTIRMNRAAALRELGELEQARDELRKLLLGLPEADTITAVAKGRARYHLALCEWRLGDRDVAQREAEESLNDYGNDADAAQQKNQTEQLLADLKANKPLPQLAKVDAVAALEQARVRFRARAELATLPLDQSALPLLDQMLGPAESIKDVFERLDRQYREQNKPAIWFLPIDQPISPHLDELLGKVETK